MQTDTPPPVLLFFAKAVIRGGASSDLFADKVEVAGYTNTHGTFVAPHKATRHKRRVVRAVPEAARVHVQPDLFGARLAAEAPAKRTPKTDDRQTMLFGAPAPAPEQPAATPEAKPQDIDRRLAALKERRAPHPEEVAPEPAAAPQPAPKAQEAPQAAPAPQSIADRIVQTYLKLTGGQVNRRARLADIRAAMPDVPREDLDRALFALAHGGDAGLLRNDDQAMLRPEDRTAAVQIGDQERHLLWLDRPDPKVAGQESPEPPAPAQEAPKATEPAAKVPDAIKGRLKRALAALADVEAAMEGARRTDEKFQGDGRYEYDAYQNRATQREAAQAMLAKFREQARKLGIDPEATIRELGGEPNVSMSQAGQAYAAGTGQEPDVSKTEVGQMPAAPAEQKPSADPLHASDEEWRRAIYDAMQARWDAGKDVTVRTALRVTKIGPKHRDSVRFRDEQIQIARGKGWDTLLGIGREIDQLAHELGLPTGQQRADAQQAARTPEDDARDEAQLDAAARELRPLVDAQDRAREKWATSRSLEDEKALDAAGAPVQEAGKRLGLTELRLHDAIELASNMDPAPAGAGQEPDEPKAEAGQKPDTPPAAAEPAPGAKSEPIKLRQGDGEAASVLLHAAARGDKEAAGRMTAKEMLEAANRRKFDIAQRNQRDPSLQTYADALMNLVVEHANADGKHDAFLSSLKGQAAFNFLTDAIGETLAQAIEEAQPQKKGRKKAGKEPAQAGQQAADKPDETRAKAGQTPAERPKKGAKGDRAAVVAAVRDALDRDDAPAAIAALESLTYQDLQAAADALSLPFTANPKGKKELVGRLHKIIPKLTRSAVAAFQREKHIAGIRSELKKDEHALADREAWEAGSSPDDPAWAYARLPVGLTKDQLKERIAQRRRELAQAEGGASPEEPQPEAPAESPPPAAPAKLTSFGVQPGTTKGERKKANKRALAILAEKRDEEMTDEDREALARYTGNGGVGDSQSEFYTPPAVASSMWDMLRNAGFSGGSVLEPSCGTGVYLHTAPEAARVTGVEMDPTSARIAGILHGPAGHDIHNASLERFATQDGRQFDAVIGNVPFCGRGSLLKDDKPELPRAEQYFVDTALDKCRDGGLVAVIVPTGIMDAQGTRSFRERIMAKAEFLGGRRLPNTCFQAAHTEVTSDILVFRKRPQEIAGALGALDQDQLKAAGVWDAEFLAGTYFQGRGAPNVMGRVTTKMGQFGEEATVAGSMEGVPEALSTWAPEEPVAPSPSVPAILESLGDDAAARRRVTNAALRTPYQVAQPGDVRVVNGVRYVLQGQPPRWNRAEEEVPEAVEDARHIAELLDDLAEGRARDPKFTRAGLIEALDSWVAAHGTPASNKQLRAWLAAPFMPRGEDVHPEDHAHQVQQAQRHVARILGAVNADGSYSDLVTGRVREAEAADLETVATRLALEWGGFTADQLATAANAHVDTVLDRLHASSDFAVEADGKTWTTIDGYMTGDLWPKLDAARAAAAEPSVAPELRAKYQRQVAELEKAIDPKSLEDVEVTLSSGFVQPGDIEAWFTARNDAYKERNPGRAWEPGEYSVTYDSGAWSIRRADDGGAPFRGNDAELVERFLNRDGVRRTETEKVEALNREFKTWLLGSERREAMEDRYNRLYRGFRAREFSNAPIHIAGMNTEGLKAFQYGGVRWALAAGKGIVAADVGLGKTVRGLMLARLAKQTGQAKRPTFVVPKSVVANWVAEAEKWFPGSRVLVIGESMVKGRDGTMKAVSDDEATRKQKLQSLTQNDWDFVFITQPAWNELDVSPELRDRYENDNFWTQRADALDRAKSDKKRGKIRTAFELQQAKQTFTKREGSIFFDDLGVDMLVMDEAHCFPAGTLVDGRPIESFHAGDLVRAFDHAAGRIVLSRVANLQIRVPRDLYRIEMDDGTTLICTGKHPIFTPHGYIFAEDIAVGDVAFKNKRGPADGEEERRPMEAERSSPGNGDASMRVVRHALEADAAAGLEAPRGAAELLLQQDPLGAFQGSPEEAESLRHGSRDCAGEGAIAGRAGRWLGGGAHGQGAVSGERHPVLLQGGHRTPRAADRHGRDRIAPIVFQAGPGPQEGGDFMEVRVARVAPLDRGVDETFGGVCKGGVVYNIEVERHHNYIAEGILVHNSYKNLFAARQRFGESPKFLGGSGQSKRALDTFHKTRALRDANGGKGVFMLTATPTKNSPLEVYSMLSHIAPEAFERMGIRNAEDFLDRFCVFETRKILGLNGEYDDDLCVTGFKNLSELREVMRRYIDHKTAEDVGLELPERDDQQHMVDMTPAQEAVYEELRSLIAGKDDAAGKIDAEGEAHIFSVMDKMQKATLDLSLLGPEHAGEASPKMELCAKNVARGAADGGQVVFCEAIDTHEKIVDMIAKHGIPRERIAIINGNTAKTGDARQKISDAFNSGRIDVVIANKTAEEGVNLQKRTADIHHLDLPWEPATLQQRNGRGLRQGNTNKAVRLHTYLARGSFDGYRWQTISAKKDWQDLLWNGGDTVENLVFEGGGTREEMMIALSKDPDATAKKLSEDKEAQQARTEAAERGKATDQFTRYQEMRRSLAELRAKHPQGAEPSAAMRRLEYRSDVLADTLRHSKWFAHKELLDSVEPAYIEPSTNVAWTKGRGFELAGGSGGPIHYSSSPTRWVVEGVDLGNDAGPQIIARQWGATPGDDSKTVRMDAAKFKAGVTPIAYSQEEEEKHIAAEKAAREAKAKKEAEEKGVAHLGEVAAMPPVVVQARAAELQRQLKASAAAYKDYGWDGPLPLVRPDGSVFAAESYDARKRLADNDFLLPTPENREKAIAAYADLASRRRIRNNFVSGRRGKTTHVGVKASYPDSNREYSGFEANPWEKIIRQLYGDGAVQEARAAADKRIRERIDAAPDFRSAVEAAQPAVQLPQYGGSLAAGAWPADVVAKLWDKAAAEGLLHTPLRQAAPSDYQGSINHHTFSMPVPGSSYDRTNPGMKVGDFLNAVGAGREMPPAPEPAPNPKPQPAAMPAAAPTQPPEAGQKPAEIAGQKPDAISGQKPAFPGQKPAKAGQSANRPDGGRQLVEHVTANGKTIRGVIRRDLSYHEAKKIDPYTFRKDGGMFIREKHL